jgi:hypothetical protein
MGQGFLFMGQGFLFMGQGSLYMGQGFLFMGQGFLCMGQCRLFPGQRSLLLSEPFLCLLCADYRFVQFRANMRYFVLCGQQLALCLCKAGLGQGRLLALIDQFGTDKMIEIVGRSLECLEQLPVLLCDIKAIEAIKVG